MDSNILLLGATGDLAKTKILPAFSAIGVTPLLYGRKDVQEPNYIKGELEEISEKLKNDNVSHVYVSLPPMHYELVLRELTKLSTMPRIALEKPFGVSYADAQKVTELIKELQLEDKVYLVDHYLGKPALIDVLNLSTEERKKQFDEHAISYIFIDALETNTAEGRGAFYDSVGTIKDFVQSHIMAIIATLLMQEGCEVSSTECRKKVLEKLVFKPLSLVLGQYEGFREVVGVRSNSDTETYATMDFIYNNCLNISVRVGKAMNESRTDVAITYKDGSKKTLNIQSKVNSYEAILKDFIDNQSRFSLSYDEALLCWKITEEILKSKAYVTPIVYPQGSSPDRIR